MCSRSRRVVGGEVLEEVDELGLAAGRAPEHEEVLEDAAHGRISLPQGGRRAGIRAMIRPRMRTSRRTFLHTAAAGAVVPVIGPRVLDALERRLEAFGRPPAGRRRGRRGVLGGDSQGVPGAGRLHQPRERLLEPAARADLRGVPAPRVGDQRRRVVLHAAKEGRRLRGGEDSSWRNSPAARPSEIVITRNTTESIGTVVHGIDLAPGDEAVMCNQDYGSMLEQFRQQSRRRGLKCVEIAIPLDPKSDEEMVDIYARAITPRTKLLLALAHGEHHRADPPGAQDRRHGARARRRRDRGRGALVRARGVQGAGPRRRLPWRQPAQVAVHAARRGHPARQEGQDPRRVAALRRDERARRRHPEVRADRHAPVVDGARHRRRHPLSQHDRQRAEGSAAPLPAAVLDRQGARHPEGVPEHAAGQPGVRDRERRDHRDDAGRPGAGAVREAQDLHGGHRHAGGQGHARDAAPLHDREASWTRWSRRSHRWRPRLEGGRSQPVDPR